jgi:hypothetical protein
MDEFKKYLQQHRNGMDEDVPSGVLLQRIHASSAAIKKSRLRVMIFRIAAAACLLVFITVGARWIWNKKDITPLITNEKLHTTKNSDAPLLAETNTTNPVQTDTIINSSESMVPGNNAKKKELLPVQLLQSFSYNYTQLVNLQLKNIRHTPVYGETGNYFNDFKHNLQQMDADEVQIKINITRLGLNDILLEQLINVYQQKISLLKDLQHEIGKLNNRVKENQLPTDSVHIHYINI